MSVITCDCDCDLWNKIGAPVDKIPECVFGGIHYFKNKRKAAEKWIELKSFYRIVSGSCFSVPYYWAVHLNGKHILKVKP